VTGIMKSTIRSHARRTKCRGSGFVAAFGLLFLLLALILSLLGCSPERRYKVLSIFFDGVPNPDAPLVAVDEFDTSGKRIVKAASFVHKPYADGKCADCHGENTGGTFESFTKLDDSVCLKCHKNVPHEYPRMHGPVALAQCSLCHVPHESSVPALLKDNARAVCTQCHLRELLPATPADHLTDRSCLDCHSGHGGTARALLKHGWSSTTRPVAATQPSARGGAP